MIPAFAQAQACGLRRILQASASTRSKLATAPQRSLSHSPATRRGLRAHINPGGFSLAPPRDPVGAEIEEMAWIPSEPGIPTEFPGQQFEPSILTELAQEGQHHSISWAAAPITKIESEVPPMQTLERLQQAVQAGDRMEVFRQLYAFTANSQRRDAVDAVATIPRPTISAIFQALDPYKAGKELDPTYSLQIEEHLQEFSSVTTAFDNLGVRRFNQFLLAVLETFADILLRARILPLASELTILLRCAGATSDVKASKRIWQVMDESLTLLQIRNAQLYDEFISARFLTKPIYFQNDFGRLRFRPRGYVDHRTTRPLHHDVWRRLEGQRVKAARRRRFMYGSTPLYPTRDLHWTVTLGPLEKIWNSMYAQGIRPNDALFATFVTAFGRSGKVEKLQDLIEKQLELTITDRMDHSRAEIIFNKPNGAPRAFRSKLIEAVVKTLASIGLVVLARRLLDALVARHRPRLTPLFWSEFLACSYISSSGSARKEWRAVSEGELNNHCPEPEDVIAIWDTMTSDPHNVEPTFNDLDKYVRALIHAGRFEDAKREIRNGVTYYRRITGDVAEALLIRLHPSPPPSVHRDFMRQKAGQHTSWYSIRRWCGLWTWRLSMLGPDADSATAEQMIPDFVAEFRDFMAMPVTYRTQTGLVQLEDEVPRPKYRWVEQLIRSRPISVFRRDREPDLTEDDLHGTDELGALPYDRTYRVAYHTSRQPVRVRSRPKWESVGLEAACLREVPKGHRGTSIHLAKEQAADCIEW